MVAPAMGIFCSIIGVNRKALLSLNDCGLTGVCVMRQWECEVCGFIYDEAEGLPEQEIPAGTPWESVPDDWECPHCAALKDAFILVE